MVVTIALVASGAMFFGFTKLTTAQSFHTGQNVSISDKKPVESTVFAAGTTVSINTEVFGDVFCAGQNVSITAPVHGDVICAGQTVTISGQVSGDVRLLGQTVTISAPVTGNATIGGQSFILDESGSIDGDASIGTSTATLNGAIGRDLLVGSEDISLNGTVGRNVTATVSTMDLGSAAKVSGDVTYTSSQNLSKNSSAIVAGTITQHEPTVSEQKGKAVLFGIQLAWFAYALITFIFTGFVLALLFPRLFKNVSDNAMPKPWSAMLVGFVAHLAVPVVLFIVFASIIGVPLALLICGAWLLLTAVSGLFAAFYLGRLVLSDSRQKNALVVMLVGTTLLAFAQLIPVFGILVLMVSVWIGTGMLLMAITKHTPNPTYALGETGKTKKK